MATRLLLLLIVACPFCGCFIADTSCCDLVSTNKISERLYVEDYRTFCAGVYGELDECYLTDSSSFRQKIGSYDEHYFFRTKLVGDSIIAYDLQPGIIYDTVGRRRITRGDLLKFHDSDSACVSAIPLFGKNTITCDSDYYPMYSYRTNEGDYMSEIQYKCGDSYKNAIFYTDSSQYCVFIGVYIPGSLENNYSVKRIPEGFDFFNVTERRKVDTLKVEKFSLIDLRKKGLARVCKDFGK